MACFAGVVVSDCVKLFADDDEDGGLVEELGSACCCAGTVLLETQAKLVGEFASVTSTRSLRHETGFPDSTLAGTTEATQNVVAVDLSEG